LKNISKYNLLAGNILIACFTGNPIPGPALPPTGLISLAEVPIVGMKPFAIRSLLL
jgi:hypothetical protein